MFKAKHRLLNIAVAGVVAGALVLSVTNPISARRSQAGLTTLRLGYMENNPKWTPTLDPAVLTDTNSYWIGELMNAGLVNLKQVGGKVVVYGDLAKSWKVSKDGKTYTFTLRSNAKFSDGHQVTAQDVVFSIRRYLLPKTASPVTTYDNLIVGYDNFVAGKSSSLGVKALNKTTVQVRLTKRAAYFLYAFTYPTNNVLEQRVLQGKLTDSGGSYMTSTCKANVGAGPFKPVCASQASNDQTSFYGGGSTPTLTLVPNPFYYGHKPKLRLVIPAIDSNQTGYADFLSGNLDETFDIPSTYIARWRGKPGAIPYPSTFIEWIAPNLDEAPFNNIHCRLAVDYAIDRTTLTKKVLNGAYNPLYTVVPPGFIGFYNGKDTPHFNPAKARSELAKCPGGIHNVTYVYRTDTTDRRASANALQGMLQNVGINIKLKGMLRSDWLKIILQPLSKSHTELAYNDWSMDYPDPQDYLELLLYSHTSENDANWNNATYDKLVRQGNAEFSPAKRAQYYIKAQKLVLKNAAFIPVDIRNHFDLVNPKVHGLVGDYGYGITWAAGNDWSKVYKSK